MKRQKLLLKEFIEAKSYDAVNLLLQESLSLLEENPQLFNSIHSSSDDRMYIDHAYKTIAKLQVERDRGNDLNVKSLILSLQGIMNYFKSRPGHEDFVALLKKNIDSAEGAVFDLRNPQNDQALKSRYMRTATVPGGLFPRMQRAAS